ALHFMESDSTKEVRNVCKSEDRIQPIELCFVDQGIDHQAPDAVCLVTFGHSKRSHLAHRWRVKVKSPTAHQLATRIRHHEVAHIFGHFKLRAREHDAPGGIAVDEIEQSGDVLHGCLTDVDAAVRGGLILDEFWC